MSRLTPQEAQTKWANRLKGATADIQAGVNRVTEAPGVKAAAKQDKMLQNLTASVQSGKWKRGVLRVTLDEWKSAFLNKGIGRISAGVDAASGKMSDFYSQLFPFQDNLRNQIAAMPDVTLDDNLNRMVAFARGMAGFVQK